ncbi:PAS domain S-box protein [Archaeoglobus profundus]|uniref:PAS domain S-box protein n=1 Tax=Archaeoglobus profundus TaxID=84156 RepID=UPI000B1CB8AF|nr:PAS domain S-box protein [Archaeoglobus profundus]
MRFVIATQNSFERSRIAERIESEFDCEIIECESCEEVYKLAKLADCLIVGIEILCGLKAVKDLRVSYPYLPIVVILNRGDERYISHALKEGVDYYVFRLGDYYSRIPAVALSAIEKKRREFELDKFRKALEEKERLYRSLTENLPDLVILHDGDKIAFVNSAVESLGYTKEEVLGRSIFEFIHPESADLARERIETMIKTGKSLPPVEEKIFAKDGSLKVFEIRSTPIDIEGKRYILVVARDITRRKKYEMELEKTNRILRTVNSINELMVRAKNDDDLLKGVVDLLSRVYKNVKLWVLNGEKARLYSTNGRTIKDDVYAFPIVGEGEVLGFLSLEADDIEGDEMAILKTLAKDIGFTLVSLKRRRAIKEALRRVEENTEKIATLIDQIRNPLTVIQGIAEIKHDEYYEKIVEQVKRIERLLEDLDKGWVESKKVGELLKRYDF